MRLQDYAEAMHWYRKAAEQGNAIAQFNLGVMYSNGEGIKRDQTEAVKWYRLAAAQGNVSALCNLGVMYDGTDVGGQFRSSPRNCSMRFGRCGFRNATMWFPQMNKS